MNVHIFCFLQRFINNLPSGQSMSGKTCGATGKKVVNDLGAVVFKCPKCGEHEIVRSTNARRNALKYSCPGCGFTGPN